jgi:hypothetical protein
MYMYPERYQKKVNFLNRNHVLQVENIPIYGNKLQYMEICTSGF